MAINKFKGDRYKESENIASPQSREIWRERKLSHPRRPRGR